MTEKNITSWKYCNLKYAIIDRLFNRGISRSHYKIIVFLSDIRPLSKKISGVQKTIKLLTKPTKCDIRKHQKSLILAGKCHEKFILFLGYLALRRSFQCTEHTHAANYVLRMSVKK